MTRVLDYVLLSLIEDFLAYVAVEAVSNISFNPFL